jgi:hypothetical protein
MPFYHMPVDWSEPEKGLVYTNEEFRKRIAANIEALNLQPGTNEFAVINDTQFFLLDRLFNGTPN